MITSSVILDIVIAAIVVISILIGKSRGLFRTLAELVSYLAAWLGASVLAESFSHWVAEWLRPVVESKIHSLLADVVWSESLESLPEFLQREEIYDLVEKALSAGLAVDLGPMIEEVLQRVAYIVSFLGLFIVVLIALRVLIRVLNILTYLPVVHQFNALGGILLGAAKGLVLALVLLWLSKETGLLISAEAAASSVIIPYLQGILSL